jgi:hypothetical protein
VLAWAQALQQIQSPAGRLPGLAFVFLQLLLDRCEHRGLSERRDRERAPGRRGAIPGGDGTPRLCRTVALGAPPGPQRLLAGLAKRRYALVGWIFQDAPPHAAIPDGLARTGPLTGLGQAATARPNRQAVVADPGKDLADDTGFVRDDLIAGLPPPSYLVT